MPDKDLLTAELIALSKVPDFLGGRMHVCTVRRWYSRGVRGHKLKVLFVGGRIFTTAIFLDDFFAAIGTAHAGVKPPPISDAVLAAEREFAEP